MGPVTMSAFVDELMKIAFNEADAQRTLNAAKRFGVVKRVNNYFASPAVSDVAPLVRSVSKRLSSVGAPEEMVQLLGSEANASLREAPVIHQTKRIINAPPRGDAISFLRSEMPEIGSHSSARQVAQNPGQRKMLDAIIKGHEVDEQGAKRGLGMNAFGHANLDVILREHNRVTTLPQEHAPVGEVMKRMRTGNESEVLKPYGIDYGKSPRLSRHARRHISNDLEKSTDQAMRTSFGTPQ
jgi:hypothetical protein